MPNLRVCSWNIQVLSHNKISIATMAENLAEVIVAQNADIVILLEVRTVNVINIMGTLSAACAAASAAAGGNATDYTGWLLSYATGGEHYGFLIRDLNLVRPLAVTGGPTGAGSNDDGGRALDNLELNRFATWPGTFGALANAYTALPAGNLRDILPLTNVFAGEVPAGRKRAHFSGSRLGAGGYALGYGFRMPCLAMFRVLSGLVEYTLPMVVCHLGAVAGGANPLARGQFQQFKDLHIAQKFGAAGGANSGYLDVDGAAHNVQELLMCGDFNIDFLENAAGGGAIAQANRRAFDFLTPTAAQFGSGLPAALPGAPGAVPMVPFMPPAGVWPEPTLVNQIPHKALKAAITTEGTMLVPYVAGVVPPTVFGACFDNFFFGGTQLSATVQLPTAASAVLGATANAGEIDNVTLRVLVAGGGYVVGGGLLDVAAIWAVYNAAGTHNAPAAPNLAAGAGGAGLTVNDQLIAARFLSDHVPSTVQFNLP